MHYVTINGMVEHAETSAFGVATLSEAGIELKGHGRQPDLKLKFRERVGT